MEKKKKREKPSLNNTTETEAADSQQKEGEIQGGVTVAKRFYRVESPMQENATGVHHQSPQILQWPYTPQTQPEQSLQFPAHSCQVQQPHPPVRHQHQQQVHHGALPQGQPQPQPQPLPLPQSQPQPQPQPQPQQQSVPYWPHTEYPAIAPPSGPFYPFPPGSNDSNWQATAYAGAHPTSDHATPYGYQGGYAYPVGYPGPWDPAAWWAHSHHQSPYPFPYPPFGGGYGYMTPPAPPTVGTAPSGACQRGIIRPPAGLSQKHQRLWEAQSMENVQLWGALARAESEIAAYRGRLMKLESDLFAMKAHHDAAVDGSAVANTAPQTARKGRNKRATVVTASALPSSDNVQPRSRGRKVTTYKTVTEEKEKNDGEEKESKYEVKEKVSTLTIVPQGIPAPEEEQVKVAAVLLNGNDFELDKNKSRITSDFPTAVICHNHAFSSDTDNVQYGTVSQISTFGTSLPVTGRKENGNEHAAERKGPLIGSTPNLNFMESKASESGEDGSASYRGVSNRVNGWAAAATAGDGVRNLMLEGRMHTFYDHGNSMRSDPVRSGKLLSPWGYVCEDASEEQDDVVPSGKEEDDEEMEEDADSALNGVRRQKGESILRLDSTSGIPK
ncbi:hypothetical protein KI387_012760, partial [Taxus chinensis]